MKPKIIEITTPYIKLDSFLKLIGAASTGGEAKIMAQEGRVQVDGAVCTMRGKKLVQGSTVSLEGETYEVVQK